MNSEFENTARPRVLLVEDQESMRQMLVDFLEPNGFDVTVFPSADAACEAMNAGDGNFDAVLTDIKMPGMNGLEFCQRVQQFDAQSPVIVMTAYGSLETAIEAIRAGAFDFVTKPVELELLKACLDRAAENSQLRRRVRFLEAESGAAEFEDLIGNSDVILQLKDQLTRVVDSSAPVLITGESGAGKEVVAAELHAKSLRSDKPFVAVNCAALPEALLESELFGHVRGAFTDAGADRVGLFVRANGGTLFLDEIGELPIGMQPKLLRALEQMTVRPVGSEKEIPIDVRLIAATNRDLPTAIEEKSFREDLYYRINVLEISVPPLRNRGTDILLLANHFYRKFADTSDGEVTGFEESTLQKLMAYDWPGNVRELRNVVERAVVMAAGHRITKKLLPDKIVEHQPSRIVIDDADNQPLAPLETIQRRYIEYVLKRTGGNKSEAAKILGLDRKTLYRKLKEK